MNEQGLFALAITFHESEKYVLQLSEFRPEIAQMINFGKTRDCWVSQIVFEGERLNVPGTNTYRITDIKTTYHTVCSNN